MLQGQDFVDCLQLYGLLGHTENDTGVLILGNGVGALFLHLQHTLGSIVSHTGHDYAYGVPPRIAGGGAKENIDRRSVSRYQRTVLYLHIVSGPAPLQEGVSVAG